MKTQESILKGAFFFLGASILVKGIRFIQSIITANVFGVSSELDTFFIAFNISMLPVNVLFFAMQAVLVATLSQVSKDGEEKVSRFVTESLILSVAISLLSGIAIIPLAWIFMPFLAPGFNETLRSNVIDILIQLFPFIIISGPAWILTGVLQSKKRFFSSAIIPGITPLLTVLFLFTFKNSIGIKLFVICMCVGILFEFLLSFWILNRTKILSRITFNISKECRKLAGESFILSIGTFLMFCTSLVEQAFATLSGSGGISILYYGMRLPYLLIALSAVPLGASILSHFSELLAKSEKKECARVWAKYTLVSLIISVPVVAVLIWLSKELVALLFAGGSFGIIEIEKVTAVQQLFLLQLPAYIGMVISQRLLTAMNQNKIVGSISGFSLLSILILNAILEPHLGLSGVALSTSMMYWIAFSISAGSAFRIVKSKSV